MEQYLDMLFGEAEGYVAVASKGDTWEEQQFVWPLGRDRLLRWVDRRINECNIFICPALRSERQRIKGEGIHLRWLWADIDWEKVKNKTAVNAAIKKLLPARVLSGTGANLHVYLELDREVTIEEHYRLNQGLRDLLEADAKHPDNSLLRLPGTYNRKGRPVEVTWARDKSDLWAPADLLKIPAIRDTVVADHQVRGDGTYEQVDVTDIYRGIVKRWVDMGLDEAYSRFGSRHSAVYQITERLIKRGFTRDEVHCLMENFEPGLSKEEEENGYDMHQDIDRCIARHPMLEEIVDDDDGVFTELTDEENAEEDDKELNRLARKRLRQMDVEDRARQLRALRSFNMPPDETSGVFSDEEEVDEETRYLINQLASVGDNISITGQYKSGKTLFVCNLVRCIADGEMFLDEFEIDELLHRSITIGFWSCEMTRRVLISRYLNPQEFTEDGKERLHLWHGRGFGVNLMDEVGGKAWAIKWLKSRDIGVWVIDSFARLCSMAGIDPNDNDQVLKLLRVIDEIKEQAGVSELFLIAHTGRSELAKERARGATVFDDWADARWVITRDGDTRFFHVEGRDVELTTRSLKYDQETRRIVLGTDKHSAIVDFGVRTVTEVVANNPGITKTALGTKIKEHKVPGYSQNPDVAALINETEELGFIKGERVPGARGRKVAYQIVPDGVPKNGKAAVRELDFSKVKTYQGSSARRS